MNGYLDCNCQESIKCFLLCRAQEQPLAQGSAGGDSALLGLLCEGCGPPSWEDTGLGAASTEVWYSGVICTLLKKKILPCSSLDTPAASHSPSSPTRQPQDGAGAQGSVLGCTTGTASTCALFSLLSLNLD